LEQVVLGADVGTAADCPSHSARPAPDRGHRLGCGSLSCASDFGFPRGRHRTKARRPDLAAIAPSLAVSGFLCSCCPVKGKICPAVCYCRRAPHVSLWSQARLALWPDRRGPHNPSLDNWCPSLLEPFGLVAGRLGRRSRNRRRCCSGARRFLYKLGRHRLAARKARCLRTLRLTTRRTE